MDNHLLNGFCWADFSSQENTALTEAERYQEIVNWAGSARGHNPDAFDAVTEWLLDDSKWTEEKLAENKKLLMDGILARFQEQTVQLRKYLRALEPSGVVNEKVFGALDHLEAEVSGRVHDGRLREVVSRMFADFSVMRERSVREQIAGGKTGSAGTDTVEFFGYLNGLKDFDAGVQWALFMPDAVKNAQQGFHVESFTYKKLPGLRFIGKEGEELDDAAARRELFARLDALSEYASDLPYDVIFIHHDGQGVDVNEGHALWGRFMKADTPVPEGFKAFDFVPERRGGAGVPYISQFAYAVFAGDDGAMHSREGFDSDAMYDITRNTMLAEGVNIPYPDKYWVAEVFLEGHEKSSTAYMFSAEM